MDTQAIKTDLNLMLHHAESAGAKFHKAGKGFASRCPIHGGDNPTAFSVYIADDGIVLYKCWTHCGSGDIFSLVMKLNHCDFKTALEILGGDVSTSHPPRHEPPAPQFYEPPAQAWQARALKWITAAESALWDARGVEALSWLRARGLRDETIRAARLGYIPNYKEDAPKLWGDEDPEPIKFYGQGILIPGMINGKVWYLKQRFLHPRDPKHKYTGVRGNKSAALYGAASLSQNKPAVFCEGEFDALLLKQELKDLASVMTLGSATNELNILTWGLYLLQPSCFIVGYDTDKAGKKGKEKLTWLRDVKLLNIPALREGDKDFTDFHKSGGNLFSLIESVIREDAPIFVNWTQETKPATIRGQYWESVDGGIEAYYLPAELSECLETMQAIGA